jgi:hypothetical protein
MNAFNCIKIKNPEEGTYIPNETAEAAGISITSVWTQGIVPVGVLISITSVWTQGIVPVSVLIS